jgi:hypothetical protein
MPSARTRVLQRGCAPEHVLGALGELANLIGEDANGVLK